MATSDDTTNHDQEPERHVSRPDYRKVALAYEQRRAEVEGGDALLDTLKATLDAYEYDIRQRGEYHKDKSGVRVPWIFPDRLALAARLAGAFKPRDRGELGDLMAALVGDYDALEADFERRVKNVAHGHLPEGVEDALLPVVISANILWLIICESPSGRQPTAEGRRRQDAIDYLAEQLQEHVAKLRRAVYGFDDDDDDGEDDGDDSARRTAA